VQIRKILHAPGSADLEAIERQLEDAIARQRRLRMTLKPQEFHHQVAGHKNETLLGSAGLILKPMVKSKLFLREAGIYEDSYRRGPHRSNTLMSFTPAYYGVVMLDVGTNNKTRKLPHLVLGDHTRFARIPCICDIKIGRQTFEPSASAEKKAREVKKYPYQRDIGFRLTGFKCYDAPSSQYISAGKAFGRSLLPTQVNEALALFFSDGRLLRRRVILSVIHELERMLQWMMSQTDYHFYCSSILIVYEGAIFKDDEIAVTREHSSSDCFLEHASDMKSKCNEHTIFRNSRANKRQCANNQTLNGQEGHGMVGTDNGIREEKEGEEDDDDDGENEELGFIYDAGSTHGGKSNVRVSLIDFAHTLPSPDGSVDEDYIYSLKSLLKHLHDLISHSDQSVFH
jgi:1D-myo-inositol-tetrakisphosphate 5-kinase/inositol-polyphosphate multikinase